MISTNKRVLVIADLPILPANAGNKARIWSLMNNLRDLGHDVWFLGLGLPQRDGERIREAWGEKVHIIPKVRARSARPLTYGVRRVLQDRLVVRGVTSPDVDYWYWPHWDSEIKKFASLHEFEVVIVEYVFFSKALLNFGESVLKIIDTHDVFTDRAKKLRARNIKSFYRYLTREEEARGLSRADAVIAIQQHEASHFRTLLDSGKDVITVGHTVDLQPLALVESPDILFIASDNHLNIDGITHFLQHCFAQIRSAVPKARLLIAGSICKKLSVKPAGVEFMGEVADLESAYARARVIINPMLAGTGLKTKSVEALGYGKPLVTTRCGAEGLEEAAGTALLVADDPDEFAANVVSVLSDKARAMALAKCAFEFATRWNAIQLAALTEMIPVAAGTAIEGAMAA